MTSNMGSVPGPKWPLKWCACVCGTKSLSDDDKQSVKNIIVNTINDIRHHAEKSEQKTESVQLPGQPQQTTAPQM